MKSLAIIMALLPLAASAATITVNTTADNLTAGDGKCTLREAIGNVNAAADTTGGDCEAGSGAGDMIKFGLAMPTKIRLKLGELLIQRDVSIENPAPGSLHIDGVGKSRVFEIAAGTASMLGVTIERGGAFQGGGVLVAGGAVLSLANCVLAHNAANADDAPTQTESAGGAIYNAGTLNLVNCTFSRNVAAGISTDSFGGGIYNSGGTVNLSDCLLKGNTARGGGEGGAMGGAIYSAGGSVMASNCILSRNTATFSETNVDAAGGGIANVDGTLIITGCRLFANRVTGHIAANLQGGGIYNTGILYLSDSTLLRNVVFSRVDGIISGGGLYNDELATATISTSTFERNLALATVVGENYGGGIDNEGAMTLTGCTLNRNVTLIEGEGLSWGGGIYTEGYITTLTNCTLTGNRARSCPSCDAGGGGLYAIEGTTLTNCTLSGNTAQRTSAYSSGYGKQGGGLAGADSAALVNTIVANSGVAGNCDAPVNSAGHNLSSDGTCFESGGTDLLNTKPHLAPLGNYGGPTQTMALCTRPGTPVGCTGAGPARDAGDDTVTGPPDNLSTDQRGLPRLSGAHVDIGAYEVQ